MKRIFLVAFATYLLVSCSSKDSSLDEPSSLSQPLVVQSSLLSDVTTKGLLGVGGEIGVFRTTDNGYALMDNVKYMYGTPSWSTSTPIYVSAAAATIIGYYPYSTSYTNCTAVSLASKLYVTDVPIADELCYQKKSVNNISGPVAFTLKYVYAKVILKIKKTSYQGAGNITNITFNNDGVCKTGTLNMTTGVYTSAMGNLSLALSPSFIIPTYSTVADIKVANILMIPCTFIGGSFTISLTVDGQTITSAALPRTSFVAATQYTYNLDLIGTSTGFAAVSCTDWNIVTPPVINPSIN